MFFRGSRERKAPAKKCHNNSAIHLDDTDMVSLVSCGCFELEFRILIFDVVI